MNGLQITGMKLSSPAPAKKTTTTAVKKNYPSEKMKATTRTPLRKSSIPVQQKVTKSTSSTANKSQV